LESMTAAGYNSFAGGNESTARQSSCAWKSL
jgi:hypothetical protein